MPAFLLTCKNFSESIEIWEIIFRTCYDSTLGAYGVILDDKKLISTDEQLQYFPSNNSIIIIFDEY